MAAAEVTLNKYIDTGLPMVEAVDITLASDGDWYVTRKFRNVYAVQLTQLGDMGASDAYSVSSITYTTTADRLNKIVFKAVGTTAPRLMVMIYGDK